MALQHNILKQKMDEQSKLNMNYMALHRMPSIIHPLLDESITPSPMT